MAETVAAGAASQGRVTMSPKTTASAAESHMSTCYHILRFFRFLFLSWLLFNGIFFQLLFQLGRVSLPKKNIRGPF